MRINQWKRDRFDVNQCRIFAHVNALELIIHLIRVQISRKTALA